MIGLRLTVGIPTQGKRLESLKLAIGSALAQTVPVRVLVSDQGGPEVTGGLREEYKDHPFVRFFDSPATTLWGNWCHAAECCDTEVFAWLQDDDVVAPHFASRVLSRLDDFPPASVYIARLAISFDTGNLANWWQATGPYVPMDLILGKPGVMPPNQLAFGAYFTSHALSPAVAFRCNPDMCAAVRRVPANADLFAERSVLAEFSKFGPAVCDPAIVGLWHHHVGNESRNQQSDADRQFRVMLKHIDPIVSAIPDWQNGMRTWAYLIGHDVSRRFLEAERRWAPESANLAEAISILEDVYPSLKERERVKPVETATNGRARRAEKAVIR